MADCGATGSALDRTAARFISSALSGNNQQQQGVGSNNASLAGKAIASFVTGVASNTGVVVGPNPWHRHGASSSKDVVVVPSQPLMPTSIPKTSWMTSSSSSMASPPPPPQDALQYDSMRGDRGIQGRGEEFVVGVEDISNVSSSSRHGPLANTSHTSWQGVPPQVVQPHAMQFQMMQQQMALMKMVQEQKMYQEYQQRQQQQQVQQRQQRRQQQQKQQQRMQNQTLETQQPPQQPQEQLQDQNVQEDNLQDSLNNWHANLQDEFQSFINNNNGNYYKNNNVVQDDAKSTMEEHINDNIKNEEDLGHEGYVEGVTMERLAAAWEEAEREFSTEDYANLGSAYYNDDYYNDYANDVEQVSFSSAHHMHYEFSPESERYGFSQNDVSQQHHDSSQHAAKQQLVQDLMAEGMTYFHEGNLSEAILCFESELRNVNGDNAEAWLMLGKCHAENDEDRKAITCLENAVERDPYSSDALLALGVSYVNELDHDRALKYLNHWVTHNPTYAGYVTSPTNTNQDGQEQQQNTTTANTNNNNALIQLKSLLNQAKAYDISMHGGNMEGEGSAAAADVLETLGVLCNVSREYTEAVECFQSALQVRPNDHQLWNKLGATLANSGRSEEAQEAYQKALAIKPRYARSWLNMAIAHSNLQNHDEASRCYLQALSLNPGAVHIWSYLRISLTCTERWDLLPLAASQDLDAFREYFDFVK
jgi:Flp pilus assembly protein TadD, contains TPR repeats